MWRFENPIYISAIHMMYDGSNFQLTAGDLENATLVVKDKNGSMVNLVMPRHSLCDLKHLIDEYMKGPEVPKRK